MLGTFTIAEPDAIIAFTGARVIKDTLGIELPPGFQSSQAAYQRGMIDEIVNRHELKSRIATILKIYNLE